MSAPMDASRPVRAGEELDAAALLAWLRANVPALAGELASPGAVLQIEQFPRGHSNLTYLVRAGGTELVLRRPPIGSKVKTAHDMGREFRILSRLAATPPEPAAPEARSGAGRAVAASQLPAVSGPRRAAGSSSVVSAPEAGSEAGAPASSASAPRGIYPLAPRPVAHCDDASVIGAPFYLMRRIRGVILRGAQLPQPVAPERVAALHAAFIDALADLHALDWHAAGLGDLGKPDGYVERQVAGWTKRYADAKTDEIPEVEAIARWLAARVPAHAQIGRPALIHNDWKLDNLVLDPDDLTRVIGVLDWEMSTIGDPLMDLGTALGYWIEETDAVERRLFPFGPTFVPGSLTRVGLVERYQRRTGLDCSGIVFHYCFALFKTAVVAQQIYARFKRGLTTDERFASLILGVQMLVQAALRAADAGSIAVG